MLPIKDLVTVIVVSFPTAKELISIIYFCYSLYLRYWQHWLVCSSFFFAVRWKQALAQHRRRHTVRFWYKRKRLKTKYRLGIYWIRKGERSKILGNWEKENSKWLKIALDKINMRSKIVGCWQVKWCLIYFFFPLVFGIYLSAMYRMLFEKIVPYL